MQIYIKTKGLRQIGPLIRHNTVNADKDGRPEVLIEYMLQCDKYMQNVSKPYHMESTIKIFGAMCCRYIGPEESLKFGYDKIFLEVFESDILLKGASYTICLSEKLNSTCKRGGI